MSNPKEFVIEREWNRIDDAEITSLLTHAYVGGGFTSESHAAQLFQPCQLRSRGDVVSAWSNDATKLLGVVFVVMPHYSSRRFAHDDEAELHLLAVDPSYQGCGIGSSLIENALDLIEEGGIEKTILWSQVSMRPAQQLYKKIGFVRNAARDPYFEGKRFLLYEHGRSSHTG